MRALTIAIMLMVSTSATAVTLQWTVPTTYEDGRPLPSADITGYTVQFGQSPGNYTLNVPVGLVTTHTYQAKPAGFPDRYYVGVIVHTVSGISSGPSNSVVVSHTPTGSTVMCDAPTEPVPTPPPTPTPSGWTQCAVEWGQCVFTGTRIVRFGADGAYVEKQITGGAECWRGSFDGQDPAPAQSKHCDLQAVPTGPTYRVAAVTGQTTRPLYADVSRSAKLGSITFDRECEGGPYLQKTTAGEWRWASNTQNQRGVTLCKEVK